MRLLNSNSGINTQIIKIILIVPQEIHIATIYVVSAT